jgi:hypothetical protein
MAPRFFVDGVFFIALSPLMARLISNAMLKRCLTLALVLAMLMSGAASAFGRGVSVSAQGVVICTGEGLELIQLDADGNPVTTLHVCPDCLPAALAADEGHRLTQADTVAFHAPTPAQMRFCLNHPHHRPPSRAPPVD